MFLIVVFLHHVGRDEEEIPGRTNAQVPWPVGEAACVQQGRRRLLCRRQGTRNRVVTFPYLVFMSVTTGEQ